MHETYKNKFLVDGKKTNVLLAGQRQEKSNILSFFGRTNCPAGRPLRQLSLSF